MIENNKNICNITPNDILSDKIKSSFLLNNFKNICFIDTFYH